MKKSSRTPLRKPACRPLGIAEAEAWWRAHEHLHSEQGRPTGHQDSLAAAACAHFGCTSRTWGRIRAKIRQREHERIQTKPLEAAVVAAMATGVQRSPLNKTANSQINKTGKISGSQTAKPQALSPFADRVTKQLIEAMEQATSSALLRDLRQAIDRRLAVLEPSIAPSPQAQASDAIHLAMIDAMEAWLSLDLDPQVARASKSLLAYVEHQRHLKITNGKT